MSTLTTPGSTVTKNVSDAAALDLDKRIRAHVETHMGKVTQVFSAETHPNTAKILHVPVAHDSTHQVLVTCGMSHEAMQMPVDTTAPPFLELMFTLPAAWPVDDKHLQHKQYNWPLKILQFLARYPQEKKTWLGWGHSLPNGFPSEAFADNTRQNALILLPSAWVEDEFFVLPVDENKQILFLSVVPLYQEELDYKIEHGAEALVAKLVKRGISDLINPARTNVMKKRFGLF